MVEKPDNIVWICSDCAKSKYPNAGKFTEEELRKHSHVKACFGDKEHMWVKVYAVKDGRVLGMLDNDPVDVDMKYGDTVSIAITDVEDVYG